MNAIDGIETITSCQGRPMACPYVLFYASEDGLEQLRQQTVLAWEAKGYWYNILISYDGRRGERWDQQDGKRPAYWLQFYDTLALMRFTQDCLLRSLADQFKMPAETAFLHVDEVPRAPVEVFEPFMTQQPYQESPSSFAANKEYRHEQG
jgi:hypothetical protein